MQDPDSPQFASPPRAMAEDLDAPVREEDWEQEEDQKEMEASPGHADADEDVPEPAASPPQPLATFQPTFESPLSPPKPFHPISLPSAEPAYPSKPPSAFPLPLPVDTTEAQALPSDVDSLLIDLYRYTSQTGGKVSSQLKSRISQIVNQFAVRAHNLPAPPAKSKVKGQIQTQPKPVPRRNDPLGDLHKAIEGFTVKIAGDIQRIKDPSPVTQVVTSAFLELFREIGNLELYIHPHRTNWEVLLLLMQQPGSAVTLIRSLPRRIKSGDLSRSKGISRTSGAVQVAARGNRECGFVCSGCGWSLASHL